MRKIGVLTGGGDCPGLNAAIRAIVRKAYKLGIDVMGIRKGWEGLIKGDHGKLSINAVSGILYRGGTIIGTSRTNPFVNPEYEIKVLRNLSNYNLDALIVIGGEDTLGVAYKLWEKGFPVIGIPKTIDNDIKGTDMTFGFDTAVKIATEAIDRLHTTAESHNRVMVIEVMGRNTGWIATYSGIAGGADMIIIPEFPVTVEEVCKVIETRHRRSKDFSIIVVAEGAKIRDSSGEEIIVYSEERDQFGHVRLGGIGNVLGKRIEKETGFETRVTILGHVQRGGSPSAYDRILATRFGIHSVEMATKGIFGKMAALRGNDMTEVDLSEAVSGPKFVDEETYRIAEVFFG